MNSNDQLIELITRMKESLEREIAGLRTELAAFRTDIVGRFDAQSARLDRQAALWQTGSRWSCRMDTWAEKLDANADATQRELMDLKERVRRIEQHLQDGR
jgi:hypothetical protein